MWCDILKLSAGEVNLYMLIHALTAPQYVSKQKKPTLKALISRMTFTFKYQDDDSISNQSLSISISIKLMKFIKFTAGREKKRKEGKRKRTMISTPQPKQN